jgi:hypothetical protein
MASLIDTNPYLRDTEARRRMLEEDALDSSAFEGARGLKPLWSHGDSRKRRSRPSRKKASKAS